MLPPLDKLSSYDPLNGGLAPGQYRMSIADQCSELLLKRSAKKILYLLKHCKNGKTTCPPSAELNWGSVMRALRALLYLSYRTVNLTCGKCLSANCTGGLSNESTSAGCSESIATTMTTGSTRKNACTVVPHLHSNMKCGSVNLLQVCGNMQTTC